MPDNWHGQLSATPPVRSRRARQELPLPVEIDLDAIMLLPEAQREEELAKVKVLEAVLASNPLWRMRPHAGELEYKRQQIAKIEQATGLPRKVRAEALAKVAITGDESRGQVEYLELNSRGVRYGAAVAGNKFGKTHINIIDCAIQTLPREFVPPWLQPYKILDPGEQEVRIRFVGVDLPQWLAKVWLPKCREIIPAAALWKGEFDKAWNDRTRMLRFADGSWWDCLTHDMPVDAYAGTDVDRVAHDEEPPGEHGRNCYEESLGRIVVRNGDIRWTLTPLFGLSWLYYELTGPDGQPLQDGETHVVTGHIDHNPFLSDEGRRAIVKRWSKDPLKLEARQKGRWVHFEGLVYPEFHVKRHVTPDREPPRAPQTPKERQDGVPGRPLVPIRESIDAGIDEHHAMALTVRWMNPDGSIEVFHTHRIWGGTVQDMADHIKEVRRAYGYKPQKTKGDPAMRNRNPATGKSLQWAFRQQGIHIELGNNDRETGINEIKQRLRAEPPMIVFHADGARDLVDPMEGEFVKHRWKKPKGQTEDAPKKADVIKRDDDCLDALRYDVVDHPVMPAIDRDEHDPDPDAAHAALREHLRRLGKRRRRGRVGGVFR